MRTEISQAKRENTHYLENVSKGKEIEAIVGRKRRKGMEEVSPVGGGGGRLRKGMVGRGGGEPSWGGGREAEERAGRRR